jgi:hypothetical protein
MLILNAYTIYQIIIMLHKICKHLHAKLAIQKSVNVFFSPWRQVGASFGNIAASCSPAAFVTEPSSVKWLASAKKIPATINANLKITIKTRCSMLTCVGVM